MISNQGTLRKILITELAQRRARNPAYSTRAFASALRLNSGALSGILNGKRRVSSRMALSLGDRLSLDPEKKSELLRSFAKPETESSAEKLTYEPLDMENFRLISEWQHFAILSLARKDGVPYDSGEIADRLGISGTSAQKAIEALLKLELIQEKSGRLVRTKKQITTSDGIASSAIRKAHLEDCELAAKSLERDSVAVRDFSSITFRLDPESLKKVAEISRAAEDKVMQLSDTENGLEVYRMSIHIFPLTRISQKESKK